MTALRPVTPDDADRVAAWRLDPAVGGEFQWFGYGSTQPIRDRIARGEGINDDGGSLAICVSDDDPTYVGDVSWRREVTGPVPDSRCRSIGIIVLPEYRGQGHGTTAQRLLAAYLFAHTAAQRVQADTDIENIGEQKALERAGFTREGVLRSWQWRNGAWHDFVIYSKLRGEP